MRLFGACVPSMAAKFNPQGVSAACQKSEEETQREEGRKEGRKHGGSSAPVSSLSDIDPPTSLPPPSSEGSKS